MIIYVFFLSFNFDLFNIKFSFFISYQDPYKFYIKNTLKIVFFNL